VANRRKAVQTGYVLSESIRSGGLGSLVALSRTRIRPDEDQILIYPVVIYHEVNLYRAVEAYKPCSGAAILTRPQGSIGGTKLKILAIIHHNGVHHGYSIWKSLKENFHLYLEEQSRRNVYHHLHDLNELGLITRGSSQTNENAPTTHPYRLTDKGEELEGKFRKYLSLLASLG
jgi:DNA-binding PadR family transcriptional regulator